MSRRRLVTSSGRPLVTPNCNDIACRDNVTQLTISEVAAARQSVSGTYDDVHIRICPCLSPRTGQNDATHGLSETQLARRGTNGSHNILYASLSLDVSPRSW